MSNQNPSDDARMDAANLYREETFTDRKVGAIRVLTPVTASGDEDSSRKRLYIGQASVYTPAGTLPLNFELDAETLEDAVAKFADAATRAVEDTMKQLQEMRREAASSLVVPGQGGHGGMGPGGGGGGIQMP